ncbi:MAG: L-2-amino-thiazoline-4-carboxylic acid hydrolase [Candidatus Lokiarchaeota archaeon]|nr:L-2-amino-thiazoline-4-carboxylic acid hydrolase [Candidatus Lokiarchaeota archaeon]
MVIENDYYIKKKNKFMRDFDDRLHAVAIFLNKKYDMKESEELIEKLKNEFEKMIPDIPFIGGQKNPTTLVLVKCISDLAVFRVLEKAGYSYDEIGEFHYNYSMKIHEERKAILEKAGRDSSQYPFEAAYKDYQKTLCENTSKKSFPFDFVMEYVSGDDKSFDWGWNIHECAVQKAYKKFGDEKYLPFICLGDHYEAEGLGFGFTRTQTLGFGASLCDHRFVKNGKTPSAWPPHDLKEFKEEFFKGNQ